MARVFDWAALLRDEGIDFVERGPNVKRGELNIRCPWCASADPSHHMGLNLETGWYACWRNRAHRGKSPLRLLMVLLRVPYARARQLAGLGEDYIDPEGFDALAARLLGRNGDIRVEQIQRRVLRQPEEFLPITEGARTRRAWNYLWDRGFDEDDDDPGYLSDLYGLSFATTGDYSGRVILPYYQDGDLVTWSGRAIAEARIRYRDLPIDEAIVPAKETLYNHDCMDLLRKPGDHTLVIVEGPFDALKLDFYGRRHGVRAVALSTNSTSEAQLYLLQAALVFERRLVMMDNKTGLGLVDSMRMRQELNSLGARSTNVPLGRGDAGALRGHEVIQWAQQLTH